MLHIFEGILYIEIFISEKKTGNEARILIK